MSRTARITVGVFAIAVVLGLLPSAPVRDRVPSTFSERHHGHAALFTLFERLGETPRRVMSAPSRLPDGTLWWVEPDGVCDGRIAKQGAVDVLDEEAVRWLVGPWIEAGGTAVVLLEPVGAEQVRCDAILGHALPDRHPLEIGPAPESDWDGSGQPGEDETVRFARVEGPAATREIPAPELRAFARPSEREEGWETVAEITSASGGEAKPFAFERAVGDGRLVVVADASFVRNQRLDLGDGAVLAVDFARAYGAPSFDERGHGFVAEDNAVRYVAGSAAAPVFAGLAALGVLLWWRGGALPARALDERADEAPTLAAYLRSMGQLYARSGDYDALAERYRELCRSRVQRHFGLPPDIGSEALLERIDRSTAVSRERAAALVAEDAPTVGDAAALRRRARELDRLVEEVIR